MARTVERSADVLLLEGSSREIEAQFLEAANMSGERRSLSIAEQEKIGAAIAEVFAKAREAQEFEQITRPLDAAEAS